MFILSSICILVFSILIFEVIIYSTIFSYLKELIHMYMMYIITYIMAVIIIKKASNNHYFIIQLITNIKFFFLNV